MELVLFCTFEVSFPEHIGDPWISCAESLSNATSYNSRYKWQMDQKDFDPSGLDGRVAIQPGVGTLIFARPLARDEGYYQCFAINQVGTALSYMVHMRQASKCQIFFLSEIKNFMKTL